MKLTITFVALLFAAAVATKTKAAADPAAKVPAAICYKKEIKCCFKYAACGVKVVKTRVNAKCPEKRPQEKCIKVCKPVVAKAIVNKCFKKLVYGPKKCVNHPWLPKVCVGIPIIKKVCQDVETKSVTMPCVRKCHKVDVMYIQPCYFHKIFHYPQFCPKLTCSKAVTIGVSTKPAIHVSKFGKFIKKSKVTNYGKAIPHVW